MTFKVFAAALGGLLRAAGMKPGGYPCAEAFLDQRRGPSLRLAVTRCAAWRHVGKRIAAATRSFRRAHAIAAGCKRLLKT